MVCVCFCPETTRPPLCCRYPFLNQVAVIFVYLSIVRTGILCREGFKVCRRDGACLLSPAASAIHAKIGSVFPIAWAASITTTGNTVPDVVRRRALSGLGLLGRYRPSRSSMFPPLTCVCACQLLALTTCMSHRGLAMAAVVGTLNISPNACSPSHL